jgi:hypothetical protein
MVDALVVHQPRRHPQLLGQRLEGGDGVADLLDELRTSVDTKSQPKRPEEARNIDSGMRMQGTLASDLSGRSPRASGRRALSVVCRMAEVMATPQTLPSERIRYVVDVETA